MTTADPWSQLNAAPSLRITPFVYKEGKVLIFRQKPIKRSLTYQWDKSYKNQILRYNGSLDTFVTVKQCNDNYEINGNDPVVFDEKSSSMFFCNENGIDIWKLHSNTGGQIARFGDEASETPYMICCNGKIHHFVTYLDGYTAHNHLNTYTGKLMRVGRYKMSDIRSIVYKRFNDSIFILSGKGKHSSQIHKISLCNQKHTTFSKLIYTQNAEKRHLIATIGDQYIIILPEYYHYSLKSHKIAVFDTETGALIKTNIIYPKINGCKHDRLSVSAVCVDSKQRDELLTFGFIEQCWKSPKYKDIIKLPRYLIKLVNRYVLNQLIHVFCGNWDDEETENAHWLINVNDILQCKN